MCIYQIESCNILTPLKSAEEATYNKYGRYPHRPTPTYTYSLRIPTQLEYYTSTQPKFIENRCSNVATNFTRVTLRKKKYKYLHMWATYLSHNVSYISTVS